MSARCRLCRAPHHAAAAAFYPRTYSLLSCRLSCGRPPSNNLCPGGREKASIRTLVVPLQDAIAVATRVHQWDARKAPWQKSKEGRVIIHHLADLALDALLVTFVESEEEQRGVLREMLRARKHQQRTRPELPITKVYRLLEFEAKSRLTVLTDRPMRLLTCPLLLPRICRAMSPYVVYLAAETGARRRRGR